MAQYGTCLKPAASNYWGQRFNFATWSYKKHFFAGKFKRASNRYDRCIENLYLGRKKVEIDAACKINTVTGKYECNVSTGPSSYPKTDPTQVAGHIGQTGLSDDAGGDFKLTQQHLIIGGVAIAALLIMRK